MSTVTEKLIPAYIPWETFTTFVAHLKATAVPTRIDKSVMQPGMPTLTRGQIQSALKFLRLIDSAGNISDSLSALVAAYDTDEWGGAVQTLIREPYGEIIGDLDINVATPHQLDEKFKNVGVTGQMLQKSLRFYLAALAAAGKSFSPHLMARRKPSSTGRKRSATAKAPVPKELTSTKTQGETTPIAVDGQNPPGTQRYPLYFKGKASGALVVPSDLTVADCKVIELMLEVLKAYAGGGESE